MMLVELQKVVVPNQPIHLYNQEVYVYMYILLSMVIIEKYTSKGHFWIRTL